MKRLFLLTAVVMLTATISGCANCPLWQRWGANYRGDVCAPACDPCGDAYGGGYDGVPVYGDPASTQPMIPGPIGTVSVN